MNDPAEKIIQDFIMVRPKYELFTSKMEQLICEVVSNKQIKFHIIESRTKDVASFREKINRPGKQYNDPVKELSDLSGIRIIIYYADDAKKIEALLHKEFKIHPNKSMDKSEDFLPNQFGYLSSHLVVSLREPRNALAEWRQFSTLKAEIQVRTVLQHAWASISHALQYKRETDIPNQLKRKLFRLAGLFELADEQFVEIREKHKNFVTKISQELKTGKKGIPINLVSLTEFIENNEKIKELVKLAKSKNYIFSSPDEIEDDNDRTNFLSQTIKECFRLKIKTIDQLTDLIITSQYNWGQFLDDVSCGEWFVSKEFLLYLLIVNIFVDEFSSEYLVSTGGWSESVAKRVLKGAKIANRPNNLIQ